MDWCGMQKTKTKDTHDETTRKTMALKECQECHVGAEIKIKTNQCHGPKNRREYLPQMYATYNGIKTAPYILPPLEKIAPAIAIHQSPPGAHSACTVSNSIKM